MGRFFTGIGVVLATGVAADRADAGAWLAPEGGQEIWSNVAGTREEEVSYFESSAYWEAPVDENTSLVAAPWVEQSASLEEGWRAEAVVGVKRAVFRGERGEVMAVQAGALWRSDPPQRCEEGGAELRMMVGRPLGETGFINLEFGERMLSGGCSGERMELSAGFRPSENWLAMGQVFVDASGEGAETVNLQVSVVRFNDEGRGLQLGLRGRLDGDDLEPAFVLGLWGRPGD